MDSMLNVTPPMADPSDVTHISTLASSSVTPGPVNWKKTPVKTYSKKFTSPPSAVEENSGDSSGDKSRYGRARKPRPSGDFLSTDRRVSHYLKIRTEDQFFSFRATYSNPRAPARKLAKPFGGLRRSLPETLLNSGYIYDAKKCADSSGVSSLDLAAPTSTETVETPIHLQECELKSEASDVENDVDGLEFVVGDLVWAAIPGYPYWPAVVTRDPISNSIFKMLGQGKKNWHVNFFGDSGMRGWIYTKNMFIFNMDEFNTMKEECFAINDAEMTPFQRKSHRQRKKLFSVSENQLKSWTSAVSEAQSLLSSPRTERLEYFMTTYMTKWENKSKMRAWSSTMSLVMNQSKNRKTVTDVPLMKAFIEKKEVPTKRMRSWSSTWSLAGDDRCGKATKNGDLSSLAKDVNAKATTSLAVPFKAPSIAPVKPRRSLPRVPVTVTPISRQRLSLTALPPPSPVKEPIVPPPLKRKAKSSPSDASTDVSPRAKEGTNTSEIPAKSSMDVDDQTGPIKSESGSLNPPADAPIATRDAGVSPPAKRKRISTPPPEVTNDLRPESQQVDVPHDVPTSENSKKRPRGRPRKFPAGGYAKRKSLAIELSLLKVDKSAPSQPGGESSPKEKSSSLERVVNKMRNKSWPMSNEIPGKPSIPKRRTDKHSENDKTPTVTRSGRLSVKPVPTYLPGRKFSKGSKNDIVLPIGIKEEPISPTQSPEATSKPKRKTLAETKAGKKKSNRETDEADGSGSKEGPRLQDLSKPVKQEPASKIFIPKKASLFTGAKDMKRCSICLKAEKVVRCRGPCSLYMHVECSDKPRFVPDSAEKPEPKVRRMSKKRRWAECKRKRKDEANDATNGSSSTVEIKEEKISDVEGDDSLTYNGTDLTTDSTSLNGCDLIATTSPKADLPMDVDSKSSNDDLELPLSNRISFPNSSGIPTPPPEENGKSPEPEDIELYINGDVTSKIVEDRLALPKASSDVPGSIVDTAESITSETSEKDKIINGIKKENVKEKGWMCRLCVESQLGPCFLCGKDEGEKLRCKSGFCGKVYHPECGKVWPQFYLKHNSKGQASLTCPAHTCHTCVSDNPAILTSRYHNDRLVRCVRCPTTYHHGNHCVPAGSEILSSTQIICPRHFRQGRKSLAHLNATWCFLCSVGGSLICCDLCPNSFHVECLKISPPEGAYICEDCETGRFPLYGEIVWAKLGVYRWWPARILFPHEVPPSLQRAEHVPGEFAVRFYGTYDYYWVNRGRVFLFHEGDGKKQESISLQWKKTDEAFNKGVLEANHDFIIWNELRNDREESHRPAMKPPKYVKITSNKPVGSIKMSEADASSLTACECKKTDEDPCGPNSQCINRLLLVECCSQTCPAMEKCMNQNFEKKLYPPLVPFRTASKGWGLKTVGPLKKGDFIIEYVGEMIDEEEYKRRLQDMHRSKNENFYFLTLDKDRMLDAGPKGNLSRFMNHSCQPNCETQKWTVEGNTRVGLFALKDIPADSELVFNYNLMPAGDNKLECRCGAPNCAGFIGGKPTKPIPLTKVKDVGSIKGLKIKKKRKSRKKIKNLAKLALTNSCALNGSAMPKATNKDEAQKCSICNEGGATISCQEAQCTKMYHLSCTHLTKEPKQYTCPSHECSTCRSRNHVENCSLCINSYCSEHQEGNMVLNRGKGTLCRNCYESDSGSEWSAGGKEDDVSSTSLQARRT